jgi:hypothetical protein
MPTFKQRSRRGPLDRRRSSLSLAITPSGFEQSRPPYRYGGGRPGPSIEPPSLHRSCSTRRAWLQTPRVRLEPTTR